MATIDEHSGLEIRKTDNGMEFVDEGRNVPAPPQTPEPLVLDEDGLPVDLNTFLGGE